MAKIISGIGTSHSPSIAFAYDQHQEDTAAWKPFFQAVDELRASVAANPPDVLIFIYNDHFWQFSLDFVPTFAIGVGEEFTLAPEREFARPIPNAKGDPRLAWHLTRSLVAKEFDMTTCQHMMLDHGFFSAMPLIAEPPWPMRIIPIAVNVIQHPLPTPARCWKLGQALARAVASYDQDLKIGVVATGGLSHQLHGSSFGYTNPTWDQEFLELLTDAPERLLELTHDDYMQRGGAESVEMIVWLAMRGALQQAQLKQRFHHPGALTGLGLLHLQEGA